MKTLLLAASLAAAAALATGSPLLAQTETQTKVSHDTNMKDGVATSETKVTHTSKRKTRRPKKILGVKVGHKTVTHKTVRKTSVSSNGDSSTTVKSQ